MGENRSSRIAARFEAIHRKEGQITREDKVAIFSSALGIVQQRENTIHS
jgi:hypothetical protein